MSVLDKLLATLHRNGIPIVREENETNQDFCRRIYHSVAKADSKVWDEIGEDNEEAQEWFNEYHVDLQEFEKLPPEEKEKVSFKRRLRLVPGTIDDTIKMAKRRVSPNRRGGEVTRLIRKCVFTNPNRAAKDIQNEVIERGYTVRLSTIATTRAAFIGALQFLAREGHYKAPGLDTLRSNPEED